MAADAQAISIESGGESLDFRTWDELIRWVDKERSNWEWLVPGDKTTDIQNWASTVRNQWNTIYNQLNHLQSGGSPLSAAVQHLAPLNQNGQLLVSTTRDGQLVLDIRETAGDAAAAFAYAFLKRAVNLSIVVNREMLLGAVLTALPEYGKPAELAERLQRERANTRSLLTGLSKRLKEEDRDRAERAESYIRRGAHIAARIVRRRRDKWAEAQTQWGVAANDAVASVRAVENTYLEAMRLQAPVEYWRKKAAEHERKEKAAASRLRLFFPGITVFLLIAFWIGGSIILTNAPQAGSPAPIAVYVVVSGALAFLATLAFWVGRLFTKLYLSEHHLRNDADERAIMTETYLALTHESAAADTDRPIILNALFRNTVDGIVKEEGPTEFNVQALLSRFLTK